jgi:hypothetical protein
MTLASALSALNASFLLLYYIRHIYFRSMKKSHLLFLIIFLILSYSFAHAKGGKRSHEQSKEQNQAHPEKVIKIETTLLDPSVPLPDGISPIQDLPLELKHMIFSHLSIRKLCRNGRVCSHWREEVKRVPIQRRSITLDPTQPEKAAAALSRIFQSGYPLDGVSFFSPVDETLVTPNLLNLLHAYFPNLKSINLVTSNEGLQTLTKFKSLETLWLRDRIENVDQEVLRKLVSTPTLREVNSFIFTDHPNLLFHTNPDLETLHLDTPLEAFLAPPFLERLKHFKKLNYLLLYLAIFDSEDHRAQIDTRLAEIQALFPSAKIVIEEDVDPHPEEEQ